MLHNVLRTIDNKKNNCCVYEIDYPPCNGKACAKVLNAFSIKEINGFIKETNHLSRVNSYPLALTYYESYLFEENGERKLCIVTELCEKGNLLSDLKNRAKNNRRFSDQEFIGIVKDFVNFFSTLQEINISHRDIKPENIFLTMDGKLKIGDFGSASLIMYQVDFTIAGSPHYLSPELRKGYERYLSGIGAIRINHNPFKSDVYSLGLVFLYMQTLKKIKENFENLNKLPLLLKKRLNLIKNVKIKEVLSKMLEIPNEIRPDFKQLKKIVDQTFNDNLCNSCWEICEKNSKKCKNCGLGYHSECVLKNECLVCRSPVFSVCLACQEEFIFNTVCGHSLCSDCRVKNNECSQCIGFKLINFDQKPQIGLPYQYSCHSCDKEMGISLNKDFYYCNECNIKYCAVCKGQYHNKSQCSLQENLTPIVCVCGKKCSKRPFELFFECESCIYVCLVCFNSFNKTHIDCSKHFQMNL
jgi:serine/threonine protein kinase